MENSKKQFIEVIKQASNILVTVRTNPSIDHLAACIALTLMLNEMGKHATAVFSGEVPSVLDFLEPKKTLQPTTDSLQDFIISLDKSKADKLRYKVEDTVVKIYITPYKTPITSDDLKFDDGDFNVDVVVALGVHVKDDLDKAITAHGRILHDATVTSLNVTAAEDADTNAEKDTKATNHQKSDDLGSINWLDTTMSSLSEMLTASIDDIAGDSKEAETLLDSQVATALLTGIVAETDRFGNSKTTPATMQASARLLVAGANQELVATKLAILSSVKADDHDDQSSASGSSIEPSEEQNIDEPSHHGKNWLPEVTDGSNDGETDLTPTISDTIAATTGPLVIVHATDVAKPSDDGISVSNEPTQYEQLSKTVEVAEPVLFVQPLQPTKASELVAPGLGDVRLSASESNDVDMLTIGETANGTDAPQTYDLNKISIPASIPVIPAEQEAWPMTSSALADASIPSPEDQVALDVLKYNKPVDKNRMTIQPLRDQNGFVGQPPLHEKMLNPLAGARSTSGSIDDTLDPFKFAVTPPTLGGALTASHDQSEVDPVVDPMSGSMIKSRAIMTHDSQMFPQNESAVSPKDSLRDSLRDNPVADRVSGSGELDPDAEPTEHTGLPQFGLVHSAETNKSSYENPIPKEHQIDPMAPAEPATGNTITLKPRSDETLAELESELHSHRQQPQPEFKLPMQSEQPNTDQPTMQAAMHTRDELIQQRLVNEAAAKKRTGISLPKIHSFDMPLPATVSPQPTLQAAAIVRTGPPTVSTTPPPSPPPMMPFSEPAA